MELILIRHGATARPGHLCGATDVPLAEGEAARIAALAGAAPAVAAVRVSPALRAVATAEALWPDATLERDERLWEQDFGDWEGRPYSGLPDAGVLDLAELAGLAGPGGESFADLCTRVHPALQDAASQARKEGPVAVVAHAGVVRAALALALGDVPSGLAFEVGHVSTTRLRCLGDGAFSVISVNGVLG